MGAKVKELSHTIEGMEAEIKDTYKKAQMSKGGSQQMYKQRCMLLLKRKKMY